MTRATRRRIRCQTGFAFIVLMSIISMIALTTACATDPADRLQRNPHFDDPVGEYGYSKTNPVLVASLGGPNLAANEHIYLRRLRGPHGEPVKYQRSGSCCSFPSPNAILGQGLLDVYLILYGDLTEPVTIYINMYDPGVVRAPAGLSLLE